MAILIDPSPPPVFLGSFTNQEPKDAQLDDVFEVLAI